MQSEIGFWKENDVESKVKDFYILKTRKPEPQPVPNPQPMPAPNPQPSPTVVSRAKNKVANASNISALKNVLLQILDKYPETADIIDENLDA